MKRYFFDTEFHATAGHPVQIFPISIGIVSDDGRTLYVEFEGALEAARKTEWLEKNVLPHLEGNEFPLRHRGPDPSLRISSRRTARRSTT